ncbi:MAG TPA: NAD-dependent epimerase/dehydratase family protein, partial [Longimicrobium sp.]|nr:NAD-dependent epimerase/dehydratase family protein [Longimicrobium sp.]
MEIFVTGATGVLGREVVRLLAGAGHHVRALSRSPSNDALLSRLGAQPVRGDLFDAASLSAAVAGCEAVLHLATRIPPRSRATSPDAWAENHRIRIEGTRTLVDAALDAKASIFIYPSV